MPWIVLTGLLLLAGCGVSPTTDPGQPMPADPGEEAREWVLVAGVPNVEGYPITLRVEDDRVSGVAACNTYAGDVAISGERFEVTELSHTELGCPEPGVHDSEAAYLAALQAIERHEREAEQLILRGPDVELRFDPVDPVAPEQDVELTGTHWALQSLSIGTGPEGLVGSTTAPAWLRLQEEGSFTAFDGCNEQDGRWTLEDDGVLRVSDVVTTDMACPDVERQVEHVREVLMGEPTVQLEGRRLHLSTDERGLEYHAQ